MLLLAFRIDKDYHDGIYLLFGTVAFLCFSFSWGGENFGWPIPGLIWLVGIVVLSFMQGLFLAFLLPFDADVLVRR